MPLYFTELAPWERKNEYFHTIQLGRSIKEQTHAINDQTKALVATKIVSTNSIIASQERIKEGVDAVLDGVNKVAHGLTNVENGINELQSTFEWGISEVVWNIEQNRAVLKDILEVLVAPLDTQAKERRKRAQEAYFNGWIEDAEEEFLEAEKLNKYDFSIHISLGLIYLFQKVDKQKSLSYFKKATKYSKPKSDFYASYSLLYEALINYDLGDNEQAEKLSSMAIELSPQFSEALYQNAQYNAQLLNISKCILNLKRAIMIDKRYCLKIDNDPFFDPIKKDIILLFEDLKTEEKNKIKKNLQQIIEKHNSYSQIIVDISNETKIDYYSFTFTKNYKFIDDAIQRIKNRIKRDSYFDLLEVNNKMLSSTEKEQKHLISLLKTNINDNVKKITSAPEKEQGKSLIRLLLSVFTGKKQQGILKQKELKEIALSYQERVKSI